MAWCSMDPKALATSRGFGVVVGQLRARLKKFGCQVGCALGPTANCLDPMARFKALKNSTMIEFSTIATRAS